MGTNRNALYKLGHDARMKLKAGLEAGGISADEVRALAGPSNGWRQRGRRMDRTRLTDDHLRDLAGALLETRPDELTCDEWMDRVGGCAEAVAAGRCRPGRS